MTNMKTVDIEVTQSNINEGVAGSSMLCPIALAIMDAEIGIARVGTYSASVRNNDSQFTMYFPPEAQKFIENFDCHGMHEEIKPIKFEAEIMLLP